MRRGYAVFSEAAQGLLGITLGGDTGLEEVEYNRFADHTDSNDREVKLPLNSQDKQSRIRSDSQLWHILDFHRPESLVRKSLAITSKTNILLKEIKVIE